MNNTHHFWQFVADRRQVGQWHKPKSARCSSKPVCTFCYVWARDNSDLITTKKYHRKKLHLIYIHAIMQEIQRSFLSLFLNYRSVGERTAPLSHFHNKLFRKSQLFIVDGTTLLLLHIPDITYHNFVQRAKDIQIIDEASEKLFSSYETLDGAARIELDLDVVWLLHRQIISSDLFGGKVFLIHIHHNQHMLMMCLNYFARLKYE